jgi:hypothetical protein
MRPEFVAEIAHLLNIRSGNGNLVARACRPFAREATGQHLRTNAANDLGYAMDAGIWRANTECVALVPVFAGNQRNSSLA